MGSLAKRAAALGSGLLSKKSVPEDKQLSKEAVVALVLHSCFQFAASLSYIFVNLYIWRLTQSLYINSLYNMIIFIVIPFGFAMGGWIAKKRDRMVTYRIGIILYALFYLMVVIAGEQVADYYYLFGMFMGAAMGFYWSGILVLHYDVSSDHNRMRFFGLNSIFFTLSGLIGPALAGTIIKQYEGLSGYGLVFGLAFIMFLITAVISFRIKMVKSHRKAYYLKYVFLLMRKHRTWAKSLICFFILGQLQGLMMFLPSILLYKVLPREDMIGYLNIAYSLTAITASYLISKFGKRQHARNYVMWAGIGFTTGSALLLLEISPITVICFMVLHQFFGPVQQNSLLSYHYRLIGQLPLKGQLRIESVVIYESIINVGRTVSVIFLMLMAADLNAALLPIVILIASMLQLINFKMMEKEEH